MHTIKNCLSIFIHFMKQNRINFGKLVKMVVATVSVAMTVATAAAAASAAVITIPNNFQYERTLTLLKN